MSTVVELVGRCWPRPSLAAEQLTLRVVRPRTWKATKTALLGQRRIDIFHFDGHGLVGSDGTAALVFEGLGLLKIGGRRGRRVGGHSPCRFAIAADPQRVQQCADLGS